MISLTLTKDGKIEIAPRRLVMREDRIELAQIVVDHIDVPWMPDKHARWPKGTMRGTENIGGQFMDMGLNTDSLKAYIGDALPVGHTPDPSTWVDVTGLAAGSKHIKQVQIFRAEGQGGDKIIVRLRLDTLIPKAPQQPKVETKDSVKVGDLKVGDKFRDATGYGWKVTPVETGKGAIHESYVAVVPVPNSEMTTPGAENPWPHEITRVTGKADAWLDKPAEPVKPAAAAEPDDGTPLEKFSNYSAFVTKYENFTLDKLYSLLEQVDKTAVLDEGSHGFKDSYKEANYPAFVAATKGESAVTSSASLGQATVFARATTTNKPDDTPHDPSIAQHPLGTLSASQWEDFSPSDQRNYNRLVEKHGAWTEGKGRKMVSSLQSTVEAGAWSAYQHAVNNQKQSSHHATDGGFMFNKMEGYNIYASTDPTATREKYLKFEKVMYEVQDITMWDLYNSVKDPNIILVHFNDFSPESTKANMEGNQFVQGQYPFFGGVSWTTRTNMTNFGSGSSMIIMRIPIDRVTLGHIVQSLHGSDDESEFTIRQEMFFDPDNTVFAHAGSQWEGDAGTGSHATWNKLEQTIHVHKGVPKPGSLWNKVVGLHKGYIDPPMELGKMKVGRFFREGDTVWNIRKIDDKGVHARIYLDPAGNKMAYDEDKTFSLTTEYPPVSPKIEASKLEIGEVIEDDSGNKWQNVGIGSPDPGSHMYLAPYDVSGDASSLAIGGSTMVKISSLAEDIPDWVSKVKDKPLTKLGAQLEGAEVMTTWGQRMEVLTPGKHGEKIKMILLDADGNQLANTERTFPLDLPIVELKAGHPPLPPPAIGDLVTVSQMKAGDVISRNGVELKILSGSGGAGNLKMIYAENTAEHLKGELAVSGTHYSDKKQVAFEDVKVGDMIWTPGSLGPVGAPIKVHSVSPNQITVAHGITLDKSALAGNGIWVRDDDYEYKPSTKFKYVRKESLPVREITNYPSEDDSVWIDDLAVGDTFYYNKKYYEVDALKGDVVEASQPNPLAGGILPQAEFPTSTKVWPSGIPEKPQKTYYGADAKHEISWDDLKVGDKVTMNDGDPMTVSVVSPGHPYIRTEELGRVYADQGRQYKWHRFDPPTRPKSGDEVPAKSLWIGDVVETADGQRLKVAKAPNVFDQPFVDLATGAPELHDANAYYTYVGRADDLLPGKSPQKEAPLPSGVPGYDTPLADVKVGYIVQTKNGSRWRVLGMDNSGVKLQGIDNNGEPIVVGEGFGKGVEATVLTGTGDPVGVIDTGRKRLGDLEAGHAFAHESAYGNESFAVIAQTDAGTLVHPSMNSMGEPYITNKPELQTINPDEDVKYLGESKSHPEMAPPTTELKSGYAKKSPQIGEVELWPAGSAVVTSGNYFYIVGPSSHGKTMLTDLAGKQHYVPSKTFLVKGASNGPKPQKGIKLVASNEIVYRAPRKGEYFMYNNTMYIALTPQIKSMTVAPVDEYGNITGESQKITHLGSKYVGSYGGRDGIALLHVQKDNGPMPKLYHDDYTSKIITRTTYNNLKIGDYISLSHEPDKRYLLIGKHSDSTVQLAHLDKNGNVTGVMSRTAIPETTIEYDILERPDGLSKVDNFEVGQQFTAENPNAVEDGAGVVQVVQKSSGYSSTVVQMEGAGKGRTFTVMSRDLVKAVDKPVPMPKVGEVTSTWFLQLGDVITFEGNGALSNYATGPMRVKVTESDGNYLRFTNVNSEGALVGGQWRVRRSAYSNVITLAGTEKTPPVYEAPTFAPVAPPTPIAPSTNADSIGQVILKSDLKVGDIFEIIDSSSVALGWRWLVEKDHHLSAVDQKSNQKSTAILSENDGHVKLISTVSDLAKGGTLPESSFTEPKPTPKPGEKTTIGDMDVGEYFQVEQADGNGVFTWKVTAKDADFMYLAKVGTNPDQGKLLTTTSAHYGIKATQVPATAWENQPTAQTDEEKLLADNLLEPPYDWRPASIENLAMGTKFYAADEVKTEMDAGYGKDSFIPYASEGRYFILGEHSGYEDERKIVSVATGKEWIWKPDWPVKAYAGYADVAPADTKPETDVNKNSAAGIWHHLKVGSVFTHMPKDDPNNDFGPVEPSILQTWKVVSGPSSMQDPLTWNIEKVGKNDQQVDTFALHPDSFAEGTVKLLTGNETETNKYGPRDEDIYAKEPDVTTTPVKARAFVEAVEAEQNTGTPRLEAVAKTAAVMHKTMDEAIDSYPAANEPPTGAYVPLSEIKVGDTYRITDSKYKGWVWHVDGQNENGSHNLTAVDKKDDQPETLVSYGLGPIGSANTVEKIASDNPAATLNAHDLVPGDVFQIKVGEGNVFTWKVMSIEDGQIHLQAVGSTKGTPQAKNFKTTVDNIANQIGSGSWLPV